MTTGAINSSALVFLSQAGNLISNFHMKDFFDVLIVASMFFVFIILFIQTHSVRILFGVLLLVILYGLVTFLNLPLSRMFLNYFFGMFLVILAVVFQRELRKLFEFIGIWGMRKKFVSTAKDELRIIAETAEVFSQSKTGCLIVFPGREPIDRHIEKGSYLNGKISKPILLSIFDKNSPGHDGALIVEGDLITSFGVHLPLAEEVVPEHGTRHRAAMGISQRTDALSLVVSEETGRISLLRNGKIFPISSREELEERLENFFNEKSPNKEPGKYKKIMKENTVPIVVSLGLATVFWVALNFQSTVVQKNFLIPVEIRNLSSGSVLDSLDESEVVVTLSGKDADFKVLDESALVVSVDVSQMNSGWHKVLIKKDNIKVPSDLAIVNIEPSSVKFHIGDKVTTKVNN